MADILSQEETTALLEAINSGAFDTDKAVAKGVKAMRKKEKQNLQIIKDAGLYRCEHCKDFSYCGYGREVCKDFEFNAPFGQQPEDYEQYLRKKDRFSGCPYEEEEIQAFAYPEKKAVKEKLLARAEKVISELKVLSEIYAHHFDCDERMLLHTCYAMLKQKAVKLNEN